MNDLKKKCESSVDCHVLVNWLKQIKSLFFRDVASGGGTAAPPPPPHYILQQIFYLIWIMMESPPPHTLLKKHLKKLKWYLRNYMYPHPNQRIRIFKIGKFTFLICLSRIFLWVCPPPFFKTMLHAYSLSTGWKVCI